MILNILIKRLGIKRMDTIEQLEAKIKTLELKIVKVQKEYDKKCPT